MDAICRGVLRGGLCDAVATSVVDHCRCREMTRWGSVYVLRGRVGIGCDCELLAREGRKGTRSATYYGL